MISKFSKFYSKFITGGSGEAPVEGGRSGGLHTSITNPWNHWKEQKTTQKIDTLFTLSFVINLRFICLLLFYKIKAIFLYCKDIWIKKKRYKVLVNKNTSVRLLNPHGHSNPWKANSSESNQGAGDKFRTSKLFSLKWDIICVIKRSLAWVRLIWNGPALLNKTYLFQSHNYPSICLF